jgi:energy-coupling factor transport system permease protein
MKRGALSSLIPAGDPSGKLTALHRLQPRTKVLATLALLAFTAWAPGRAMLLPAAAVTLSLHLAGVSPLDALRRLKKFFWFLFAVALFPALFAPGPELSNPLGGTLPVSAEGLEAGLYSALRMAVMFLGSWLLMRTTPPEELVTLADRAAARSPWCKEGLGDFFRTGLIAFQMLTPLCQEADRLLHRETEKRSMRPHRLGGKARLAAGLLAPLVVLVFKEPERFLAAEAAGEGGRECAAPPGERK